MRGFGLIWGKIQQKCGGSIQVKGGLGRCICGGLKLPAE